MTRNPHYHAYSSEAALAHSQAIEPSFGTCEGCRYWLVTVSCDNSCYRLAICQRESSDHYGHVLLHNHPGCREKNWR